MERHNANSAKKNAQKKPSEEMLSLRDIVDIFLNNWKWFLGCVVLGLVLAVFYILSKPLIYQRNAVLLIKEQDQRSKLLSNPLSQLGGIYAGSMVKNEVYILQSHYLMKDVVRKLDLDVFYNCRNGLRNSSFRTFDQLQSVFARLRIFDLVKGICI